MLRTMAWTAAFAVAAAAIAYAQLPPQPPPVASPLGQGNEEERIACHPDVVKFCQTQLEINPQDVLGILGCLQTNRTKISNACQKVLAGHGV